MALHIKLSFVGFLARKIGKEATVEVEENTTLALAVSEISEKYSLGITKLEPGGEPGYMVILLNGKSQKPGVKLKDGDEISFLPIVAGG